MTQQEEAAIRGALKRLQADANVSPEVAEFLNNSAVRSYLDTWVTPCLRLILPGEGRNPRLAADMAC